jgi:hypothetical protein
VVAERLEHLISALGRKSSDGIGDVYCAPSLELVEQLRHALARHGQG